MKLLEERKQGQRQVDLCEFLVHGLYSETVTTRRAVIEADTLHPPLAKCCGVGRGFFLLDLYNVKELGGTMFYFPPPLLGFKLKD